MQTPVLPPPLPRNRSGNWWSRNWKWLLPLLCGAGLASAAGFVVMISMFMKSSEAYKGALARATTEHAVIDALGAPIADGFFTTGSVSISGPSGRAELAIPIQGPKGRATVYVEATKKLGTWHFDQLIVEIEASHTRMDLLEGETATPR